MPTTQSNFVRATVTLSGGASAPVVLACASQSAGQLASATGGAAVDKFTVDLATAGYAKNGAFALALAASTPVTVDLTATATASGASAGDTAFATLNEVVFHNYGLTDVAVHPGASNGFTGPLSGTAPVFTVPAGSRVRWHSPAGWTVDGTHKSLTFDPGGSAASVAVALGGA